MKTNEKNLLFNAEIYSPYVGDSEKAIVELFDKARQASPTILFIDEIDTLVSARDYSGSASHSDRILAALLTEMDGLGSGIGGRVILVGATNRPEALDSALTRPGRLDTILEVGLPDTQARQQIFETVLRNVPHEGLRLEDIAEVTAGFSGADIECLVRESVLLQLTNDISAHCLQQSSLEQTLKSFIPSLSRGE